MQTNADINQVPIIQILFPYQRQLDFTVDNSAQSIRQFQTSWLLDDVFCNSLMQSYFNDSKIKRTKDHKIFSEVFQKVPTQRQRDCPTSF